MSYVYRGVRKAPGPKFEPRKSELACGCSDKPRFLRRLDRCPQCNFRKHPGKSCPYVLGRWDA